jgi:hypothetical protein
MSELQRVLVQAFVDNIRVLRERGGQGPSEDEARERANNYICWLTNEFEVKERGEVTSV